MASPDMPGADHTFGLVDSHLGAVELYDFAEFFFFSF